METLTKDPTRLRFIAMLRALHLVFIFYVAMPPSRKNRVPAMRAPLLIPPFNKRGVGSTPSLSPPPPFPNSLPYRLVEHCHVQTPLLSKRTAPPHPDYPSCSSDIPLRSHPSRFPPESCFHFLILGIRLASRLFFFSLLAPPPFPPRTNFFPPPNPFSFIPSLGMARARPAF